MPTEDYHASDRPRRADANVTKLRTILVEFDTMPLEQQAQYVIEEKQMPFSLMTFSGSKSFHFLITLAQPVASRAEYASLVARVYKALGGAKMGVDEANKNPSRLSRTPGAIRDNGNVQTLIENRGRMELATLEAWLVSQGVGPDAAPKPRPVQAKPKLSPNWKSPLNGRTLKFLMFSAPPGTWSNECFIAVCDMVRSHYTEDEIVAKIEQAEGSLDKAAISTIRSACRRAQLDMEMEQG